VYSMCTPWGRRNCYREPLCTQCSSLLYLMDCSGAKTDDWWVQNITVFGFCPPVSICRMYLFLRPRSRDEGSIGLLESSPNGKEAELHGLFAAAKAHAVILDWYFGHPAKYHQAPFQFSIFIFHSHTGGTWQIHCMTNDASKFEP